MSYDEQGELITPSQDQGFSNPNDVFNDPVDLIPEDDGLIQGDQEVIEGWGIAPQNDNSAHEQQNSDDDDSDDLFGNDNSGDDSFNQDDDNQTDDDDIFEDELVKKHKTNSSEAAFNEEEAIKKLKEQGYNIQKEENLPEDEIEKLEVKRLDADYASAMQFLDKTTDQKLEQKVRDDIAKEYISMGRENEIGKEEFEYDVSEKIDKISQNEATKQMYVDRLDEGIKAYAQQLKDKKQSIISKQEERIQKDTAERRSNLQGSIRNYLNKDFLGVEVTPEMAKSVYQEITSGEFTKEVNNNPKLVAEFALFKLNREAIIKNATGATYGEGVKAGVDSLMNSGNVHTSKSPLGKAMTQSSKATGPDAIRRNAWQMQTVQDSEQKPAAAPVAPPREFVAGRGG